jgi:hypothetical protein
MTKKDFQAIADILRERGCDYSTVRDLCGVFKRLNPRFNATLFEKACGYEYPCGKQRQ